MVDSASVAAPDLRLPNVFLIGAAKSGTTSLYRWLVEQPEFFVAERKEPSYFGDPTRGFDWYAGLYKAATAGQLIVDASTNATLPTLASGAAARIADQCPGARLIYLVRHPLARLRSQYRFDRRRGVVSGSLGQVLDPPDDKYAGRSLYFHCLSPYIEAFPREQICVVRFEDLVSEGAPAWRAVLDHLGLAYRPHPQVVKNRTSARPARSPIAGWFARHPRVRGLVPAAVRRPAAALAQTVLPASDIDHESTAALPQEIVDLVWADAAQLAEWLGQPTPLWDVESDGN